MEGFLGALLALSVFLIIMGVVFLVMGLVTYKIYPKDADAAEEMRDILICVAVDVLSTVALMLLLIKFN